MHDYIWEKTDDPDKLKQIWDEKYKQTMFQTFEGNVQTIDYRRGSVILDISGVKLFFNPLRVPKGKSFQEGERVKFNIAFNFIGPIAIDPDTV
jgi:hypothetical protein